MEIKKLIKCVDANKGAGVDTIPPKLIKIAADFLTPLLTTAIDKSTEENTCPDSAKIALVVPLDKGKPNKNEILNFRPISETVEIHSESFTKK